MSFQTDTTTQKLHSCQLLLAAELKRICEKHNVKYFMIAGTLLGAVRHKGFIPWDDDMDIALKRADYNKLLAVLPKELPEGFVVSSFYTDPTHCQPISAVMNTKTIITDPEIRKRFYGCPYIVGVDIVALDYQMLDLRQKDTDESKWLRKHCAEYGFILRYPKEKEEVTGITYESWHFRDVGEEAAAYIMEYESSLEEYLEEYLVGKLDILE